MPTSFSRDHGFYVSWITLRTDLVWSDNSPLTAYDAAFTINTVLKFRLGFNWQAYYDPSILDHVEALDNFTLKFYYNEQPGLAEWRYGALLGIFVNKNYWEPKIAPAVELLGDGTDETARSEAVVALENLPADGEPVFGIYQMNRWQREQYYENVANPNSYFSNLVVTQYSDGTYEESKPDISYTWNYGSMSGTSAYKVSSYVSGPYFEKVTFVPQGMDNSSLSLLNGNVDLVFNPFGLPLTTKGQLDSSTDLKSSDTGRISLTVLLINQNKPYLAGVDGEPIRMAMACLIDQDNLAGSMLQSQVSPAYSVVPPQDADWLNPAITSECSGQSEGPRLTTASKILAQSGFNWFTRHPSYDMNSPQESHIVNGEGLHNVVTNTDFPELILVAPPLTENPLGAATASFVLNQLKEIGIVVNIQSASIEDRLKIIQSGDYDLAILGYSVSQFPSYLCTILGDGVSFNNLIGYSSDDMKQECDSLALENDMSNIKEIVNSIQVTVEKDLPIIPLYSAPIVQIFRTTKFPSTASLGGLSIIYEPHQLTQVVAVQ